MRYAILRGTLAGRMWWPADVATVAVEARIERSDASTYPHGGPFPTLRDAMLHVTNPGDFQSAGLVPSETFLDVVEETRAPDGTVTRRTRTREVRFACWHTDDMRASDDILAELP